MGRFELFGIGNPPDALFWFSLAPSDLGLPTRQEGLYIQSAPDTRHREHIGRALLHLTLARKQVSHEALNLHSRGEFRFAGILICCRHE